MPELPDIVTYIRALEPRLAGRALRDIRIAHPFLLRSVDPPVAALRGKRVLGVDRLGKRIAVALEDDLAFVVHLMIAAVFTGGHQAPSSRDATPSPRSTSNMAPWC